MLVYAHFILHQWDNTYNPHILKYYQRMQADTTPTFFTAILEDPRALLQAHSQISEKLKQDIRQFNPGSPVEETFIGQCLQFLGQESEAPRKQFQIITLLHPNLVDTFSDLPTDIQDFVRSSLLNCVLARAKDPKCMNALGLLIRQIVENDSQSSGGFDEWVQPINQLIKWMGSQQPGVAEASVQLFIYFYKETTFNMTNTELPLHKLAGPILPILFQIFASAQEQQSKGISLREKILYLALQVLKTFSFFDGSDDSIVKACFEQSYQLWMSLFSSILKSSLAHHLGIKKYVMKILVVIYRDMNNFCENKMRTSSRVAELLSVWEFSYKFIPCYLATSVWNLPSYEGEQINQSHPLSYFDDDLDSILSAPEALAHNILEFLSVIASSPLLTMVGKVSIYHTMNSLLHYYLLPSEEFRVWTCNISYFLNAPDHESIRGKILNIINQIIEKNGDYAIQALLVVAEKFLMNHSQAHTLQSMEKIMDGMGLKNILESGRLQINLKFEDVYRLTELSGCDVKESLKVRGQTWHKSEAALSILGRFAEDIIVFQSRQQGTFDIQSFVRGLIKQFQLQDQDPELFFLKGQSLYCLTRFTEIISIKYKELFCELVVSASTCISDEYPTAVRIAAAKTLTIFLRKIQKHKLKLTAPQHDQLLANKTIEGVMNIELNSQTNNYALEVLIQLVKALGQESLPGDMTPAYLLENIHRNISHPATLKICFTLMELVCGLASAYERLVMAQGSQAANPVIPYFIQDCLSSYANIITSDQKKYLKPLDIDLIVTVLRLGNLILEKCPAESTVIIEHLIKMAPLLTQIVENNEDIPIHIATTICLKSLIRLCPQQLQAKGYQKDIVTAIRCLLKIPADKSFEGASIYVGNLSILTFGRLLEKPDQEILQEVVLKVFKSRTPSVIQSLVLIYSRLINEKTDIKNPFMSEEWEAKVRNIIDFLASFSIENRMGLKILVDKWLLQQSLFRGNYTKISTFMALSKLFLLRDKRIDNLLVIGFNPSHTNINNDVNAPLKILATLIRCLKNEMGGNEESDQESDDDLGEGDFEFKEEPDKPLDVGLQKFKQTEEQPQQVGGLADRQNQQGSTCYMSAMLQFYDDGEQCDQTTEQDLIFLKDSSTNFSLKQYLTDFFLWLNNPDCPHHQYFLQCLKQLLRDDLKTLQKYIKLKA